MATAKKTTTALKVDNTDRVVTIPVTVPNGTDPVTFGTSVSNNVIHTIAQPAENPKIAEDLSRPFPPEMLRYNSAKGLTYIPISEVIARLNKALGVGNWSYEVVRFWREDDQPDWCMAHVRLTATINGRTVNRDGVGGQQIKYKKAGGVVDIGDEFKGAMSDALKKAAQSLGVGLELARTDEAKAFEVAESQPPAPEPDAAAAAEYERLIGFTSTFDATQKAALKTWWTENYPEDPKPTKFSPVDALAAACDQCVAISLGATVVEPTRAEGNE